MKDEEKSKGQLINELVELRQRIAEERLSMERDTRKSIQHYRLLFESRENAHIFAFIKKFGSDAEELVRKTYYEHGLACGRKALAKYEPLSRDVKTVVEITEQWLAGGLPVETRVNWVEATPRRVVIRGKGSPHMVAWKAAGVPTPRACDLYKAWGDGFIHAFNPRIHHYKKSRVSAGDPYCEEAWELQGEES